jgi:hypothetical protein
LDSGSNGSIPIESITSTPDASVNTSGHLLLAGSGWFWQLKLWAENNEAAVPKLGAAASRGPDTDESQRGTPRGGAACLAAPKPAPPAGREFGLMELWVYQSATGVDGIVERARVRTAADVRVMVIFTGGHPLSLRSWCARGSAGTVRV